MGHGVPSFGGRKGCIISHREFVDDIKLLTGAPNNFDIHSYAINPALPKSLGSPFPWLAGIAQCFEEYKLLGCVFEFRTTSGMYTGTGTNPSLGQVIMCTQYNANDSQFTNKQNMEQYEGAVSGVVSRDLVHGVELARKSMPMSELWTRSGPVAGQDLRLYDIGTFSIATQGGNTTVTPGVVGELWVTYKVQLLKPKLPQNADTGMNYADHFILPYAACIQHVHLIW